MSLAERLAADLAAQLVVLASLHRVELALVVRSHVVDEVRRHPEARVALGAPVLSEIQRRERRRQLPAGPNPAAGRCRSCRSHGRSRPEQIQHFVDDRIGCSVDKWQRDTGVWLNHPHLWSQIYTPATTPCHLVVITAVIVVIVVDTVNRM